MARRLIAASILATMTIVAGFSMPAVAQDGKVTSGWVCTERGAVAALQAFTKSLDAAKEVIQGPECLQFPRALTLRIIAVGTGPVEDYEGDTAFVVEVGTNRPVEKRFTIAWPGVNAELPGMGQGA